MFSKACIEFKTHDSGPLRNSKSEESGTRISCVAGHQDLLLKHTIHFPCKRSTLLFSGDDTPNLMLPQSYASPNLAKLQCSPWNRFYRTRSWYALLPGAFPGPRKSWSHNWEVSNICHLPPLCSRWTFLAETMSGKLWERGSKLSQAPP